MEINPVAVATDPRASGSAGKRAKLTQGEFMKLLVAELTNQDPLNPLDNQQFVAQIASLQELESTAALTDGIRDLVRATELSSASAMIGKRVRGVDGDGEAIDGVVERVTADEGHVALVVDGRSVPLSAVSEVLASDE